MFARLERLPGSFITRGDISPAFRYLSIFSSEKTRGFKCSLLNAVKQLSIHPVLFDYDPLFVSYLVRVYRVYVYE